MNLSLFMVVTFLLLTLVIGLYYSMQTTTFREYAVGDKRFPTATLVATVLATWFTGGGLIRNVEQVYDKGFYWILLLLCAGTLTIWIYSRLALRMGPFMNHLSIAESIGSIYGRIPRIITALFAICSSVIKIAVQVIVISQAIGICMDKVNPQTITIFATLTVIFYSAFGGVRAVTLTDVFQLATFTIIIPILAWFIFKAIDKPILDILPFLQSQPKFQFSSLFRLNTKLIAMLSIYLAMVPNFEPATMQRVYISSNPLLTRRVWEYTILFNFFISIFIVMIGLFAFVGAPDLPLTAVWSYIIQHIPSAFKGCVAISLLAMAMSTADSCLNACSVVINHDILGSLRKKPSHQIWLVRLTSFLLGIFAMVIAFFCNDLLTMFTARLDLCIPIITAPFLLALYGFRGTTPTALIGMTSGVLTILAWKQWIEPSTGINGSFIAMLVNGIAMMLAHYLLPQPSDADLVGPDDYVQLVRQTNQRSRIRLKQNIKNFFTKEHLANHKPSNSKLILVGLYTLCMTLLSYFVGGKLHGWYILQLGVGMWCIWYAIFRKEDIANWVIARNWLRALVLCLPINLLWHWCYIDAFAFNACLCLSHLIISLVAFPIHLGLVVAALSATLYPIYCIKVKLLLPSLLPSGNAQWLLLSLLALVLIAIVGLIGIAYYRIRLAFQEKRVAHFREQERLKREYKIKQIAYNLNSLPKRDELEENAAILQEVIDKATHSINTMGNKPITKEEFENLLAKFSIWARELKQKSREENHMILQPTAVGLDHLTRNLEFDLRCKLGCHLKIVVDKIELHGPLPSEIICDANRIRHLLLVTALGMVDPYRIEKQVMKVQFYTTHLQFTNATDGAMLFPAIALLLSSATTPLYEINHCYAYADHSCSGANCEELMAYDKDYDYKSIAPIIYAHYGHLRYIGGKQGAMLMVIPQDVNRVEGAMVAQKSNLSAKEGITLQEEGASLTL